ncbi:MAG: hypothetical protein K8E24_014395 [Methanobacterium paludis]|nr:hypothetical protein [Methanobacterium paludis]
MIDKGRLTTIVSDIVLAGSTVLLAGQITPDLASQIIIGGGGILIAVADSYFPEIGTIIGKFESILSKADGISKQLQVQSDAQVTQAPETTKTFKPISLDDSVVNAVPDSELESLPESEVVEQVVPEEAVISNSDNTSNFANTGAPIATGGEELK